MTTSQLDSRYAWVRLAASLLLTTVGSAGMYLSMIGLPAYQQAFGVNRAAAAMPYMWIMLGFGVGGMIIGKLVDRFGIVRPLVASTILLAVSLYLASISTSFVEFAALHALIGACGCAAVFSPLLADISRWFLRRRGFAIAICASGNYLAGTIWPPLMNVLLDEHGWQYTYMTFAWISLVGMLPCLILLTRPAPISSQTDPSSGSIGSAQAMSLSNNQLTGLLCIAGVGCCTAMAMPQAHAVALCVDLGFTATEGAKMLSLMFGFGIISRLVFGWLSDRLGGLATLWIGSALQGISLLIFMPAQGLTSLYMASALFGLFQGGIVPCYALIVREFFPEKQAASRTGVIIFATLIGMAFGGWASGTVYDLTGSYDMAFAHSILWNIVNLSIIGFLWLRSRPNTNREELYEPN